MKTEVKLRVSSMQLQPEILLQISEGLYDHARTHVSPMAPQFTRSP